MVTALRYYLSHGAQHGAAQIGDKKMTAAEKKITKLDVTIRQWKEILDKQMAISADLRDQARAIQAFTMLLKLEAEKKELEVYGE